MLIDIRPLKKKAQVFPLDIANLILSEPDYLDEKEFFAKSDVWFKALKMAQVSGRK